VQRFRALPVLWLILWMLVIPLFHVHPDADQRDGKQVGAFHTIFTPALDGEYRHPAHAHDAPMIQPLGFPFLNAYAGLLGHPELGFSFLSSTPDHPLAEQAMVSIGLAENNLNLLLTRSCVSHSQDVSPAPIMVLFADSLPDRAPPAASV
jgi:hypothetical protein